MKRILLTLPFLFLTLSLTAQVSLRSAEGRWEIVADADPDFVLAYGEGNINPDSISPEMAYMIECYKIGLRQGTTQARANRVRRRASFTNISPLVKSHWAQSSPYNNECPYYDGGSSRSVTGCVATAMAQVLRFWQLPKTMRGTMTYGYVNGNQHRVSHSFDFGATTFDWANMTDSYGLLSNAQQKKAVATLMYACGVATNMRYSNSESAANAWVGCDGINCFFDGLRADYKAFTSDLVLAELQANRPVIFWGQNPSTGGAHCFVIDGSRTDGYFHCNLGWGGGNDGYYLPTDMCGYSNSQNIVRVWPSDERDTYTPISELQGKYATTSSTPATSLEANKWYVMWNSGRAGSPKSNGVGQYITNTSMMPTGESTKYNANQLVRLVKRSSGGYYIQTGVGDYFGAFQQYGGGTTSSNASSYYNISTISSGYFAVRYDTKFYLDTNGPGSTVVGWGSSAPTDIYSNSSWQFYPVTISDMNPTALPIDESAYYTLRNTGNSGSSEGYLVVTESSASQGFATLQGVQRAVGTTDKSRYPDAFDAKNVGAYWQFESTGSTGLYYLRNARTGNYLRSEGTGASNYVLGERSALSISKREDGTLAIIDSRVTSNAAQGYLCATTHPDRQHPVGYWTIDDAGSYWQIEEAELPVAVKSISLNYTMANMLENSTLQLTPILIPSNATANGYTWSSSDTSVATVSNTGLVTALKVGTTTISVSPVSAPTLSATCTVTVSGVEEVENLSDISRNHCYTLQNPGTSSYLLAVADTDNTPTLRGAMSSIENVQSAYTQAADLAAAGTYWQIVKVTPDATDDQFYYLYNLGVQKYLYYTGSGYSFTDAPTPLYLDKRSSGIFTINWGTGGSSTGYMDYLSLDVTSTTPIGKAGAAGGINRFFKIRRTAGVEFPDRMLTTTGGTDPKPTPEEGELYNIRLANTTLYFSTNVVPDHDFTTFSLSAQPETFEIKPVDGVTNGYRITSLNGTHVGHTTINTWDFCNEASTWIINAVDGSETYIYKPGASVGFGVDSREPGAGVYTDKSNTHWVLEQVQTEGVAPLRQENISKPHPIYDLQGRRISVPRSGLYIDNRRKILK